MSNYLCFDIGGTSIKYAVFDSNTNIFQEGILNTGSSFLEMIDIMVDKFNSLDDITAIGLSSPGSVDSDTGVVNGISALPFIHGPNFKEILLEKTKCMIAIENDANCAALAEAYFGEDNKFDEIGYVVLGSGIGGAFIKNGQLLKGYNLHGSELGYTIINTSTLETWSMLGSTVNLVNKVNKDLSLNLTGVEVFEMKNSNPNICKLVNEFYLANAIGLYNFQYTHDPKVIYLGGAICNNPIFVKELLAKVEDVFRESNGEILPNIEVGKYKKNANLVGALANLLYIEGEK